MDRPPCSLRAHSSTDEPLKKPMSARPPPTDSTDTRASSSPLTLVSNTFTTPSSPAETSVCANTGWNARWRTVP